MPITERGTGVVSTGTGAISSLNLSLTGITGLAQGDIVCVAVVTDSGVSLVDPTVSGYTDSGAGMVGIGFAHFRLQYKVMGSSPDTVAVVNLGATMSAGDSVTAVALALMGADLLSPVAGTATGASGGTGAPNPPAITPSVDNAAVVVAGGGSVFDISGVIAPANYGGLVTTGISASRSSTAAIAFRSLSGGSGVSEDPGLFTGWTSGGWGAITLAFKSLTSTATLGVTQANNTLASHVSVRVDGTLSANQASQSLSANGFNRSILGTLSFTQPPNTLVASGKPIIGGALSTNQPAQTFSGSGYVVVGGALNKQTAVQTLSSLGKVAVGGGLTTNQLPETLNAHGSLIVSSTLNASQVAQTCTAVGKAVTGGTFSATQQAQTFSGSCTTIVSSRLNTAQATEILSSIAGPVVNGITNVSQSVETLSSTGKVTVGGSLNVDQFIQYIVSRGHSDIFCSLNIDQVQVLDAFAAVLSGIGGGLYYVQSQTLVASAAVRGTISSFSASQAPQILSATGGPWVNSTLHVSQSPEILSAIGGPVAKSTLHANQLSQTLSSTCSVVIGGSLHINQHKEILTASGRVKVSGSLDANQQEVLTASGKVKVSSTLSAKQSAETLSAVGSVICGGVLKAHQLSQAIHTTGSSKVSGSLNKLQAIQVLIAHSSIVVGGALNVQDIQTLRAYVAVTSPGDVIATLNIHQAGQARPKYQEPMSLLVGV